MPHGHAHNQMCTMPPAMPAGTSVTHSATITTQAAGLGAPFFLLGGLVVADAALLIALRSFLPASTAAAPPAETDAADPPGEKPPPLWRNPSALIVAATIATGNLASSLTEPLAPLWLGNGPLQYESGVQGLIFGAATVSYFIMTPIAGSCADKRTRRVPQLMVGLCVNALGLLFLGAAPWAATLANQDDKTQIAMHSVPVIIVGLALIGFGLALIDTPSLPLLSAMAEGHGGAGFGEAGAIETTAFAVGQTLGPLLSLPLVAAFDAASSAPWAADGLAPSAFPAALVHLALLPVLLLVKIPEPRETATTEPLQFGGINQPASPNTINRSNRSPRNTGASSPRNSGSGSLRNSGSGSPISRMSVASADAAGISRNSA